MKRPTSEASARHPFWRLYRHDAAMSLAVGGGDYDRMGDALADVVESLAGPLQGMRLLDLGCGSGRLAAALGRRTKLDYLGLDILPELLAYARRMSPPECRFLLNLSFSIPSADDSFDIVAAPLGDLRRNA